MKRLWQKLLYLIFSAVIILLLAIEITPLNDLLTRPLLKKDHLAKSGVIIVLAGGLNKTNELNEQTKERMGEGIKIYGENFAGQMIVAGDLGKKRLITESQRMKEYAVSAGIKPENIREEPRSKNTYQNAKYSLEIMAENSLKNAIVVTSPYHTFRACQIFKKLKADVLCQPVEKEFLSPKNAWDKIIYFKQVLREYGAIVYFKILGYI